MAIGMVVMAVRVIGTMLEEVPAGLGTVTATAPIALGVDSSRKKLR